jgi:hypothetical protein
MGAIGGENVGSSANQMLVNGLDMESFIKKKFLSSTSTSTLLYEMYVFFGYERML